MGDNYEKENWPEEQNNARFSKHSTPSKSSSNMIENRQRNYVLKLF